VALPELQRFIGERLTQDLLVEESAAYYLVPSADDERLHTEHDPAEAHLVLAALPPPIAEEALLL
jgi:hypothetical protein